MKAALIAVLLGAGVAPAAAAPAVRIVILPIVVHSADPHTDYVSHGIADMLSSRLEQLGGIEVDPVNDPEAATTDLHEALRRGQQHGGDFVLFGAFTQFGNGASLDVYCMPLDVKSEAEAAASRRIFVHSGAMGELIPKLDEVVDRVAVYVHAPGPETPAAAVEPQTPAASGGGAVGVDADALRDIAERLEALEEAVFGGGANAAATGVGEPAPES